MAKKSLIVRQQKRQKQVNSYRDCRKLYKDRMKSIKKEVPTRLKSKIKGSLLSKKTLNFGGNNNNNKVVRKSSENASKNSISAGVRLIKRGAVNFFHPKFLSFDDYQDYRQCVFKLQTISRKSCPNRLKTRCLITGRSRGNLRHFKMSRQTIRELAHQGFLPGVQKASW